MKKPSILSIENQTTQTTTMVMTVGRKKMPRKTLRAGSWELISIASASAIAVWNGTTSSGEEEGVQNDWRKFGSAKSRT